MDYHLVNMNTCYFKLLKKLNTNWCINLVYDIVSTELQAFD